MRTKPKNASEKRNNVKIRFAIHQPILKLLHEAHYSGGMLSLFNDLQLNQLADFMTKSVMDNENITICLKRVKQ